MKERTVEEGRKNDEAEIESDWSLKPEQDLGSGKTCEHNRESRLLTI